MAGFWDTFGRGAPTPLAPDLGGMGGIPMGGSDYSAMSGWGAATPPIVAPAGAMPAAGGVTNIFQRQSPRLGFNLDTANLGLSAIGTIGGLWGAFQAAKQAKAQFNYTKEITDLNLANQMKTFNTALADRARSRGVVEGQSQAQVQSYIDENKLSRYGR